MNHKPCQPCFFGLVILACISLSLATHRNAIAKQDHDATPIELSGFSISEAYDIRDDVPLDLNAPILKQLLYRIKRTSPKSRKQYSSYSRDLNWQDITTKTEDHRLWVFDRPARLKLIEKHRFQNLTPDEEVNGVYVCHCETETEDDQRGKTFLALARTSPKALPVGVAIDEPIRVVGFLYARISGTKANENNEMPVFVTDRVAWFPSKRTGSVSDALVRLSKHGVDIGLLDVVRENNTRPLESDDAEAFFQMLAAVDKMPNADIAAEASATEPASPPAPLEFNDLMQNANANFGEAASVTGTVRTCSVISVPHQDIQNRLELSTYYQLMLFPDLDGAKIVVKNKDGTKMDYRRFPVTVCCTELPEGMSPQDLERKQFVVDGYFFRFWKYQSEKADQAAVGQVSPLIIAKRPRLINLGENRLDLFLLCFVIAIIVGITLLIVGYRIADRRRQTPGEKILDSLPDRIDLTGLED